jgi:hypothetical protein
MRAGVIGREQELGLIDEFVGRIADGPAALLLSGESGIGKTALWDAGVESARGPSPGRSLARGSHSQPEGLPTP